MRRWKFFCRKDKMKLKIFLAIFLLFFFVPGKSFADMPEISAGKTYPYLLKGYYVLQDNVHVVTKNHGVSLTVDANEARVNIFSQRCWATGNVRLIYDKISFGCNEAFLEWKSKSANVVGKVKFSNAESVDVTADGAIFDWSEKIVDFYGKVKVVAGKNLNKDKDFKLSGEKFSHVKYSVAENKILEVSKNPADVKEIVIPKDPDNEK